MKHLVTEWNNKRNLILASILALSICMLFYSFSEPATITKTSHENQTDIVTTYDYKATITPNVLNSLGGTVPVGETIIKKITTAIPVDIKTTITSAEEVIVNGEHEVHLTVVAHDLWEKTFPLGDKQSFQQTGTTLHIIDGIYKIDLTKINEFITQAEEETGITATKYSLLVSPIINGTISYGGIERALQAQENLVFHYLFDSIVLASDKEFFSPIQFGSSETVAATLTLLGVTMPVTMLRTSSLVIVLILLGLLLYFNNVGRTRKRRSQIDLINKKYGNRIISVTGNEGLDGKAILKLTDIKSLLKIADEKELPVFVQQETAEKVSYFIVDGNQLYKFEAIEEDRTITDNLWDEGRRVYAEE